MKRLISLALVLALAAGLTGCWWGNDDSSSHTSSSMTSSSMAQSGSSSTSGSMDGAMSEILGDTSGAMSGSGSMSGSASTSGSMSGSTAKAAAAAAAFPEGEWSLRLVNANHPLPEDFSPATRSIKGYDERLFDERAADALELMLTDAEAAGNPLYLVSSYRSVARQKALFTRKTNTYKQQGMDQAAAEAEAAKLVARPGASEHNLALAADIVSANWYSQHDDLTEEFEATPAFAWLQAHGAEYGFILRYPKGSEGETGVSYEPWHYRYVGPAAAREIAGQNITLEAYCQQKGLSS